jgi:WD40 repeat protein
MPHPSSVSVAEKAVSLGAAALLISGMLWRSMVSPTLDPPHGEPEESSAVSGGGGDFQWGEVPHQPVVTAAAPPSLTRAPLPGGALACLGKPRLVHADAKGLALGPDAKWLVSWSSTHVYLWDAATGESLRYWTSHYGARCLGCAVVDGGRSVRIAETGAPEAGWDAWLRDCDVATGEEVRRTWLRRQAIKPLQVVLSANGSWAACWESGGSTWSLWDPATTREMVSLPGPPSDAHGLVFGPDNKYLALADPDRAGARQRTVQFLEVPTGRLLGHYQDVMPRLASMVFSPDGKAAAVSGDRSVVLVEVPSGKVLRRFESDALPRPALAFQVDGSRLVVGGNGPLLRTWDVASGKELRPYHFHGADERRARATYGLRPTQALSFAANGQALAALDGGGRIRLWEPAAEQELAPFHGHQGPVTALALSADERLLATADSDTIHVWDLASGRELSQLVARAVNSLDFARDGRSLVYGTQETGPRRWELPPLDRPVRYVADTKSSASCLLTFTAEGVHVRSSETDRSPLALADLASSGRLIHLPEGEQPSAWAALTPDGRTAVGHLGAGLGHSEIWLWDPARGAGRREQTVEGVVLTVALSPDGRTVATYKPEKGGAVDLWEANTWQKRAELRSQPRDDGNWMLPSSLAFSRGGRWLVSGDGDGGVRVWDLTRSKQVHEFRGHSRTACFVTFTRDDRRLISAGDDGRVYVWDMAQVPHEPDLNLTAEALEQCWATLASSAAAQAYQAGWKLATSPPETVAFLKQKLQPVPHKDATRVARLIGDLDSTTFIVRQKATTGLERFDELVEPELRAAMTPNRGLEFTRRLEALLKRIEQNRQPQSGERLQYLRAFEVLERIGTAEARVLLQDLATGEPGSALTREVQGILRRWTGSAAPVRP